MKNATVQLNTRAKPEAALFVRQVAALAGVSQQDIVAHALLVWARAHGSALPVTHVSRRRFLRRLREVLGMKVWPQDVLRHTAATALLEKHQDAGKVAHWLGNSERILTRNYIG